MAKKNLDDVVVPDEGTVEKVDKIGLLTFLQEHPKTKDSSSCLGAAFKMWYVTEMKNNLHDVKSFSEWDDAMKKFLTQEV